MITLILWLGSGDHHKPRFFLSFFSAISRSLILSSGCVPSRLQVAILILHLHLLISNGEEIISLCLFQRRRRCFSETSQLLCISQDRIEPHALSQSIYRHDILLRPLRIHSAGLGCNWGCGWAGRKVDNWKKLGSEDRIMECMLGRPPTVSMERREPDLI